MITNLLTTALTLVVNISPFTMAGNADRRHCEVREDGINWCNGGADIHAWDNCEFFEGFFTKDAHGIPICVLPYLDEVPAKYLYFYHPDNCKQ